MINQCHIYWFEFCNISQSGSIFSLPVATTPIVLINSLIPEPITSHLNYYRRLLKTSQIYILVKVQLWLSLFPSNSSLAKGCVTLFFDLTFKAFYFGFLSHFTLQLSYQLELFHIYYILAIIPSHHFLQAVSCAVTLFFLSVGSNSLYAQKCNPNTPPSVHKIFFDQLKPDSVSFPLLVL